MFDLLRTKELRASWTQLVTEGCNGANNDNEFRACHNQAVKILADEKLATIGTEAAKAPGTIEFWDQSQELAKSFVYADKVRAHLQRLDAAGETEVVKIDLSETYLKQAGRVAQDQAIWAGWRLGEVFK